MYLPQKFRGQNSWESASPRRIFKSFQTPMYPTIVRLASGSGFFDRVALGRRLEANKKRGPRFS